MHPPPACVCLGDLIIFCTRQYAWTYKLTNISSRSTLNAIVCRLSRWQSSLLLTLWTLCLVTVDVCMLTPFLTRVICTCVCQSAWDYEASRWRARSRAERLLAGWRCLSRIRLSDESTSRFRPNADQKLDNSLTLKHLSLRLLQHSPNNPVQCSLSNSTTSIHSDSLYLLIPLSKHKIKPYHYINQFLNIFISIPDVFMS